MSDTVVVNDKRLFTKDGQANPEAVDKDDKKATAKPAGAGDEYGAFSSGASALPPANFAGLLIGLATSVFMNLGESPGPGFEAGTVDIPAAKHSIDLLAVLQEKTRGNLEKEEEVLLTTLLYDLRLKFVQASTS